MQRVLDLWRPDTVQCDGTTPAYVLGRRYEFPDGAFSPSFLADCESCVWLMYRTQFPEPIPRHPDGPNPLLTNVNALFRSGTAAAPAASLLDASAFASDVGWGCMIRTGQSLLANALLELHNCRSSTLSSEAVRVLRQFSDEPTAPFSIHRFVDHGQAKCGKLPGQWFGPSAVASCIAEFAQNTELNCYISQGMDVYRQEVAGLQFPVLVLCGIRLGLDSINPLYIPGLRALLDCPQSVGVAGGRTGASLYFYGYQNDRLFFHDPHEPKLSLVASTSDEEVWASTHSQRLRALGVNDMDPSMLAGFLLTSEDDFRRWEQHLMAVPERERCVHISPSRPSADLSGFSDEEDTSVRDGYVVCDAPSQEVAESVERSEPGDESTVNIRTTERQLSADT